MASIYIELYGGLGNQMFQFACGKAVEKKTGFSLFFNTYLLNNSHLFNSTKREFELNIFNIDAPIIDEAKVISYYSNSIISKNLRKYGILKIVNEENFNKLNKIKKCRKNFLLRGYWQSEKYFKEIENELRKDLVFKSKVNIETEKYNDIICNTNSAVGVHVRRGDYVTSKTASEFHGTCSLTYYENAFSLIDSKIANPVYFVFSDEPDWVNQNFNFANKKVFIINHNKGNQSWQDLYLLSKCKHSIIANSSFSWWGAWLNSYNNKLVIAPKKWYSDEVLNSKLDIVPNEWTMI